MPRAWRGWRSGLRRARPQPNVAIKISDLVAYDQSSDDRQRWRVVTRSPAIEAFGTGDRWFASDFPVAACTRPFDEVFDSFKAITADLSRAEQASALHDNACRFYRLDSGSPRHGLANPTGERGRGSAIRKGRFRRR